MWTVNKCTGGMCKVCTRPLNGLHAWRERFCSPDCERVYEDEPHTKRWPTRINEPANPDQCGAWQAIV
jgi:hypothetical protein